MTRKAGTGHLKRGAREEDTESNNIIKHFHFSQNESPLFWCSSVGDINKYVSYTCCPLISVTSWCFRNVVFRDTHPTFLCCLSFQPGLQPQDLGLRKVWPRKFNATSWSAVCDCGGFFLVSVYIFPAWVFARNGISDVCQELPNQAMESLAYAAHLHRIVHS